MRIGVDARTAYERNIRGIGKTVVDLYNRLSTLAHESVIFSYHADNHWKQRIFPNHQNVNEKRLSMWGDRWDLWQEIRLPIAAKLDKVDLLHCPAQFSPYMKIVPTVVTIHDVIPLVTATAISASEKSRFRRNIAHSLKYSKKIITISEFSKNDILSLYPNTPPEKIVVIPWAANSSYRRISEYDYLHKIKDSYHVSDFPFFIAFGGEAPRKNTLGLIESFLSFCEQKTDWKLVIVGLNEKYLAEIKSKLESRKWKERVCLHGYINDEDVQALLSAANAFIFPSSYEGFGLPLLDAMACGCPILSSNLTSLPEIAGDAAIYFDPHDSASMAGCMLKFANDPALSKRLVELGEKRNANYTWEKTATKTLQVFKEVVGNR